MQADMQPASWPRGESEMAERIRVFDWAATPLGPISHWPRPLRTLVDLMLASPQPTYIAWGPEHTSLYNDGYIQIAGTKHPRALGQPYHEMWAEIWDDYRPLVAATMAGEAHLFTDRPVPLIGRPDRPMSWFTFSWAPVRDDEERVAGFYCAALETTEAVLAHERVRESEERQALLLELSDALRDLKSLEEIGEVCSRMLAEAMDLDRVYFVRFLPQVNRALVGPEYVRAGLPSVGGTYPFSAFPEAIKQIEVETPVYDDVAADLTLPEAERQALLDLGFGAWIGVPIRTTTKEVDWALYVVSSRPRRWTANEIALVKEAAERTWNAVERARAGQALRESEQRQAFLLRVSDALRAESSADAMANLAVRLLAEELGVDRCYVTSIDTAEDRADFTHQFARPGAAPLPARVRISDFPTGARQVLTQTVAFSNTAEAPDFTDLDRQSLAAVGFGAIIAAVARRGDEDPDWGMVAVSNAPRRWTSGEIALVEEVAERTWAAVQRARAEEALRESEARFRGLVRASNQVLYRHNADWSEMRQLTGGGFLADTTSPDPNWFNAYIHPDDQPHVWAAIEEAIRTKSLFELEHRVLRADGTLGWTLSRSTPVFDEHGEIVEWFGAAGDVTARKEAEEARRRFAALVDVSTEFIGMCDLRLVPFYINAAGLRLVGLDSLEQAIRTPVLEFFFPEDRAEIRDKFLPRVLREGHAEVEIRFRHFKTGEPLWVIYSVVVLTDEHDAPIGYGTVTRDITERKRTEEAREQARLTAEEALRARDEFLSIASHELRNPIAAIKATTQLMRRQRERGRLDDARLDRYTSTLSETSERLALLVEDLLDVSRLQSGHFPIHRTVVDLATLVRRAVEIERLGAGRHRLRFQLDDGSIMRLDADRMRQVISNLLDNAVKYSPDGGEVRILLSHDEKGAWLRVRDQGIGLPADALETIFEPFGRAPNAASSQIQGMGLGLYIARRIVEAHGGKLWAESDGEGKGTTMCLWLPGQEHEDGGPDTSRAGGG